MMKDDGVKSRAEVYKQNPHISPWSVQMLQDDVESHVGCNHSQTCLLCRQTAGGPVRVQWCPSNKPKRFQRTISNYFMATDVGATGL